MSCRMFSSPVESSKTATPGCALRACFTTDPEPNCACYHERKRIPSDCVDEMAVVEGDDGEAANGGDRGTWRRRGAQGERGARCGRAARCGRGTYFGRGARWC